MSSWAGWVTDPAAEGLRSVPAMWSGQGQTFEASGHLYKATLLLKKFLPFFAGGGIGMGNT